MYARKSKWILNKKQIPDQLCWSLFSMRKSPAATYLISTEKINRINSKSLSESSLRQTNMLKINKRLVICVYD